jgi:hypothetical protein
MYNNTEAAKPQDESLKKKEKKIEDAGPIIDK